MSHKASVMSLTFLVYLPPFYVHLHQRHNQRLLVALVVAGEKPGGEGPLPVLGDEQLDRAHAGFERPFLVGVAAVTPAGFGRLVRSGAPTCWDISSALRTCWSTSRTISLRKSGLFSAGSLPLAPARAPSYDDGWPSFSLLGS